MSDDGPGSEGSGFTWGLRPGGDQPEPEPVLPADVPAVAPDAASPVPWQPEETQLMAQLEPIPEPQDSTPDDSWEIGTTSRDSADFARMGGIPPSAAPASAIDALFGESQFLEYEAGAGPAESPFAARAAATSSGHPTRRAGISRTQKVLLGVAGGIVAVLALVALFFVGTRLPSLLGPAPAVAISGTPSATPSPTSTAKAVGPITAGVHPWSALLGGECLAPYTGPWAEKFTVVDCAAPHPAQMVFRGTFAPSADPTFPGAEKLQAQISVLCGAPGVIDLAAAGAYSDAQIQGSYPVTEAEWSGGEHDYFCFVSRSSGQPLTGSVAIAPVAPVAPVGPATKAP